jgi:hypothetical protein
MPERPFNERMYRLVLLSVLALAILAGCAQPPEEARVSLSIVPEDAAPPATESLIARFGGGLSRCSIDGGAWQACTSPAIHTDLTFGVEHTFKVEVAGTVSEESWTSSLTTKPRPRGTAFIETWHPFFEEWLASFGISFFGHEHESQHHKVVGDALIDAPVTTCWQYDFLERHCDGPDHYKSLLDGSTVGAYKGDTSLVSPSRVKSCGYNESPRRAYCVSDYRTDNTTVWIDTGRNLERLTGTIGCPGPRSLFYPCTST